MADPEFVAHVNRIIALDGDVTSSETPDQAVRSFSKVLVISGARVLWTVDGDTVTRLATSDPHDTATLVEVDVGDADLATTLDMLKDRRYQYPALSGPDPISFWGDVPV